MADKERVAVWKSRVAHWNASGLPQSVYAQQHDLKVHQLGYWIRRFRTPAAKPAFVPVKINHSAPAIPVICGIHLHSPAGWTVQLPDDVSLPLLAELLRSLP